MKELVVSYILFSMILPCLLIGFCIVSLERDRAPKMIGWLIAMMVHLAYGISAFLAAIK